MMCSLSQVLARLSVAGVLLILACGGARAQSQATGLALPAAECPDLLAQAEQRYADQIYMDVAPLVLDCVDHEAATAAETRQAYRLLALAYIKQSLFPEARLAVVSLLDAEPFYQADPRIDLPLYVTVVEEAREQRRDALAASVAEPGSAEPAAGRPPSFDEPVAETGAPAADVAELETSEPLGTDPAADVPAAPLTPVDVNTAGVEELDTVPGIGPALAARIVAHRDQNGAFRSVAELVNVRGIGPRSVKQMTPYLTASASASPAQAVAAGPPAVNVNTATVEELETLPGIGPALAGRILEFRASYGLFRDLNDLLLVRGIGARKLEAIAPLATVR